MRITTFVLRRAAATLKMGIVHKKVSQICLCLMRKAEIESICDKSHADFHKTFGSIFLAYTTSVLK